MNQLALKKDITSQKKEQCRNFFMPGVTEDIRPIMQIVFFDLYGELNKCLNIFLVMDQ